MKKSKKSNDKLEFVKDLLENGTIYVPKKGYKIIKIDTFDTYYQIWYKFPLGKDIEVECVDVPFKDVNQHLRKVKIKQLTENVRKT